MNPLLLGGISGVIDVVGRVADNLITSDKERLDARLELRKLGLEEQRMDANLLQGQQAINQVEAASGSLFVAGWRPAVGWVCVAALTYQFLLYPMLVWGWTALQAGGVVPATLANPPMLETDSLYMLLFGILGIGGLRTAEKIKGVSR